MDRNWIAWWGVVVLSTVVTAIGLAVRMRRWKNE
jgi:hypothetical protein